jgi:hypothetical protein
MHGYWSAGWMKGAAMNSSVLSILLIGSVLQSSAASSAQQAAVVPASTTTGAAAPAGASGASCGSILADRNVGEFKADQFCPAIESLIETFRSSDPKNYAPILSYTTPTQAFFDGLAGSMKHYNGKGKSTVHVDVGGATAVTLRGLDSLDDANGFKRNKLGLILERIRDGDGNGHHVGKVCTQRPEVAGELSFGTWVGSQILKYGLPALIKLLKGDPSKVIDKYDAMVTVERGGGAVDTSAIRSIDFVSRGRLPAGCSQVASHT